jgi:hypothetical protein
MRISLTGWSAIQRLQEAGILDKTEGFRRVVIDLKHDDYAIMYIEKAVSMAALDVLITPQTDEDRSELTVRIL